MSENKLIDTSNLRGDFFGGLTAGVVALPLALACGVHSGMGAIAFVVVPSRPAACERAPEDCSE